MAPTFDDDLVRIHYHTHKKNHLREAYFLPFQHQSGIFVPAIEKIQKCMYIVYYMMQG